MSKSNVVIDVVELKRLKERLENISIKELLESAAKKVAARHLATIIKNTPVDTGNLRRSWEVDVKEEANGYLVTISTEIEYALYVENGHRIMKNGDPVGFLKGQFFVKKSEINTEGKIQKIVDTEIEKILKGVFE